MAEIEEKDKKEYELGVLVKAEDDLAPVVALVREHNGEMSTEPRTKKLTLAYEIKKNKEAFFSYWNFKALTADAKELEKSLNTKAEVIRSLMIASPAPMMTAADHERMPVGIAGPDRRRTRVMRPSTGTTSDAKPSSPRPLSNEALEKKIEEISL